MTRYQHEPYLDGKNHQFICMLCSSLAQSYYGDKATYGIITGLIADPSYMQDFGFNQKEIAHSLSCIQKSVRGSFVDKIREPIILSTLVLPPVYILDIGERHFIVNPDSDVLIESD